MSLPTEDSETGITTARSINNGTSTQQTDAPEESYTHDKAQQDSTATPYGFRCAACDDQVSPEHIWKAPCHHYYCVDCLEQLFRLSMEDESLYPPRCCQQTMTWSDVKALVSHDLASVFKSKKEELDTQDKVYCSDPVCSTFIGARHITADTSIATCPICKKLTCVTCKSASHPGDCPADPSLQPTLEIARGNGWQRCQECGRMID